MRLSQREIEKIIVIIDKYFKDSEIYIFGSRLDEGKMGGDIDILVKPKEYSVKKRLIVKAKLKYALNKPIDLIVYKDGSSKIEQIGIKGKKIN